MKHHLFNLLSFINNKIKSIQNILSHPPRNIHVF